MGPSPGGPRPATRARRAAASLLSLGLVLGAAGCTAERPSFAEGPDATLPATTAPPRPGTVLVQDWTDGFCESFHAWQESAAEAGDALAADLAETTDPTTVRDALAGLLDRIASRTESFAASVRDGEVPDVEDGEALLGALATGFEDLAATFRDYQRRASAIDVTDPDRFEQGVAEVTGDMTEGQDRIATSFEAIDREFPDPTLQAALRRSCAAD